MNFRVELEVFRGPLDLLLFLVRRHEVPIEEIRLSEIADQFVAHLEALQALEVDQVGDFLVMASTLIEIKSRALLPRSDSVEDAPLIEQEREIVRQLLEYKKFRDAAMLLEERARQWRNHFPRQAPVEAVAERESVEPLQPLELWDLVSAMGRVLREHEANRPSNIIYDETPIETYMEEVAGKLRHSKRLPFRSLFRPQAHKSAQIGVFLAVLELVRHHGVRVEQPDLFGDLWLAEGTGGDGQAYQATSAL